MALEQEQLPELDYDRDEEYRSAQRAAVEAVHVGRATLQQSVQQDEQLNRALSMAEETEYTLDKAGRILRGMTWSGWVANMFTKPVGPLPQSDGGSCTPHSHTNPSSTIMRNAIVPAVYEDVVPECQRTAQAVQNYNANVTVLEACETEEQKQALQTICDAMYDNAQQALNDLQTNHPKLEAYYIQFEKDLAILRNRQKQSQEITRQLGLVPASITSSSSAPATTAGDKKDRAELFSSMISTPEHSSGNADRNTTRREHAQQKAAVHPLQKQQDDHLAVIGQSLGELSTIAQNLHQSIHQQSYTISSLDSRTDSITEKSKMVTRRADRMVQKRAWTPVKPTFYNHVAIRHIASGRYLAALDAKYLYLVPRFHPETCVFGLWKRQGQIFGLQNKYSNRWAGQNMLGSLACSASTFGRREEWEAAAGDDNDDWSKTRLLCCSAGWGAGGYLLVRDTDFAVSIGGCTVEERNKADLWTILVIP
ncbi:hypothetical protein ACA910_012771 [Epithemia clementina (nom. ined.)]